MDVFALDSIGITSCVALMSTKLTSRHVEMLRALGVEIRLCLDGDRPGQEAMMKIMSQLDEAKLPYRLVSVPLEVRDPDEILKQDGEEKLKVFVNSLVDPFNFALNYYKNISPLGTIDDRKKVINHFLPTINALGSQLEKDDYIYKLSEATGFSPQAIKNSLGEYTRKHKETNEPTYNVNIEHEQKVNTSNVSKEYRRLALAEFSVLKQMFLSNEAVRFYEENIKYFNDENYRQIANFLLEAASTNEEINPDDIMTAIQTAELPNASELVAIISTIALAKGEQYSPKLLDDYYKVILTERSRIHDKYTLQKALEGKSPQEQARIIRDYFDRQK